jgi:gas vesicle protein
MPIRNKRAGLMAGAVAALLAAPNSTGQDAGTDVSGSSPRP